MDVQECSRLPKVRDAGAREMCGKTENWVCSGQRKGDIEETICDLHLPDGTVSRRQR